jgi:penicillin-binding protein 2
MLTSKTTGVNKSKLINRRMFILSLGKIIVFSGIMGRLFSLQISENIKYKTLSDKNRLREWKIAPKRGLIYDYFGNVIADNTQVFQLHMIPENVVDLRALFFRLRKIVDLGDEKILKIRKKIRSQKPWETVIISDYLTWSEFSRLNLFLHELPGIKPVVSVARMYPQKKSFSHTIGYVSDASVKDLNKNKLLQDINVPGLKVGKIGLEKIFDGDLLGKPGSQRFEVNAYGKRIKEVEYIKGEVGKNFITTLDTEVQNSATEILKGKSGSICVMDIYNGDIIAMASSPSFDPNLFVHGISKNEWDSLINNPQKPLMNKSLSGLYPPGSTIKPIVALSALEFDVISTKLVVKCEGHIELYGQKYHCWKKKGHGYVGLRNAIKQSCDVYFYEVARRLGVDRFSQTAKKFGLGKNVFDNFIEEKPGIVPSTKWKLKEIGVGWVLGETLLTGIGQGYFQTSPMQLCLMTAQLANGGFSIRPRITYEKKDRKIFFKKPRFQSLFRNQENIKFVTEAMFGSTNEILGTSFGSRFRDKKYVYAGKTGTSQVRSITEEERFLEIKNKDLPYKDRDHALFVAFFPYKNPKYAISVVIEHGGTGSSGAAPLAKKIIKKVIDRDELRKIQMMKNLEEI